MDTDRVCSVDGCSKRVEKRGLCSAHHSRLRRHGSVDALKYQRNKGCLCSILDCSSPAKAKGLCNKHYLRKWNRGDPTTYLPDKPKARASFVEMATSYTGEDCLIWPFGKIGGGYGFVCYRDRKVLASRAVLERAVGPAPTSKHHAAHAPGVCHNPSCVNPKHLRWASPSENASDKLVDGTFLCGERVPSAKLAEDDVLAIRADPRGPTAIAKDYSITPGNVCAIKKRRTWRHLP